MPSFPNVGMSIEAVKGHHLSQTKVAARLGLWEKREKKVRRLMPQVGFSEDQVIEALAECHKIMGFYEEMLDPGKRRRIPIGTRPGWAPVPVDINIECVKPLLGWVMLDEIYTNREHRVPETDKVLFIHRPYECNTVYGRVRAVHPDTFVGLKVQVGDSVVYREFGGGRWSFNGVKVLLTAATDILAVVEGGNLR